MHCQGISIWNSQRGRTGVNQVCSWPCYANAIMSVLVLRVPGFASADEAVQFNFYSLFLCGKETF